MTIKTMIMLSMLTTSTILITGCVGSMPGGLKVTLKEKVVYEALITFRENDRGHAAKWKRIGEPSAPPMWATQPFPSDMAKGKLKVRLEGEVKLQLECKTIRYSKTVVMKNLTMVRNTLETDYWYLPDDEMDRLKAILEADKK